MHNKLSLDSNHVGSQRNSRLLFKDTDTGTLVFRPQRQCYKMQQRCHVFQIKYYKHKHCNNCRVIIDIGLSLSNNEESCPERPISSTD
jgi:hypothetical protein